MLLSEDKGHYRNCIICRLVKYTENGLSKQYMPFRVDLAIENYYDGRLYNEQPLQVTLLIVFLHPIKSAFKGNFYELNIIENSAFELLIFLVAFWSTEIN